MLSLAILSGLNIPEEQEGKVYSEKLPQPMSRLLYRPAKPQQGKFQLNQIIFRE